LKMGLLPAAYLLYSRPRDRELTRPRPAHVAVLCRREAGDAAAAAAAAAATAGGAAGLLRARTLALLTRLCPPSPPLPRKIAVDFVRRVFLRPTRAVSDLLRVRGAGPPQNGTPRGSGRLKEMAQKSHLASDALAPCCSRSARVRATSTASRFLSSTKAAPEMVPCFCLQSRAPRERRAPPPALQRGRRSGSASGYSVERRPCERRRAGAELLIDFGECRERTAELCLECRDLFLCPAQRLRVLCCAFRTPAGAPRIKFAKRA